MTARARPLRFLVQMVAFLLLLVQGVVVSTAISEGRRGIGAGAHVESPSAATHYAHADAGCPSCSGRLIQASAPVLAPEIAADARAHAEGDFRRAEAPAGGTRSVHASRAPPRSEGRTTA